MFLLSFLHSFLPREKIIKQLKLNLNSEKTKVAIIIKVKLNKKQISNNKK